MAIRTSYNKTSANTSYQKAASTISSAKTAKSKATASSSKKTSTSKKSASSTTKRDTFTYSTQQKKTQTKNTSSSKASSKRDTLTISSQAAKIKNTDNVKKGTASKNAQSSNKSKTSSNVAANMTKANSSSKMAKSTSTSGSKATKAQINNAVSSLAAKNAGISIASDGTPKINSSSDAKRYMNELNKLKGSEVSIKAATAAGVKVDSYGNPIINSALDAKAYMNALNTISNKYSNNFKTMPFSKSYVQLNNEDHQKMLIALGDCAPQSIKDYTKSQGVIFDGYTLMGICIGESAGGKYPNYFGSLGEMSESSKRYGDDYAIKALIESGIANNKIDANKVMAQDNFYTEAGSVIAHLNNANKYNSLLTDCYECLTENLKNDINAWRKGEKNAEDSSSGYNTRFTYRGN